MSDSLKFKELTLRLDNVMLEIERQKRRLALFTATGESYDADIAQGKIEGLQVKAQKLAAMIDSL